MRNGTCALQLLSIFAKGEGTLTTAAQDALSVTAQPSNSPADVQLGPLAG